jgi:ABC-type transport system involved in Fe-S cluster assembly fused permease/ATPase subunit
MLNLLDQTLADPAAFLVVVVALSLYAIVWFATLSDRIDCQRQRLKRDSSRLRTARLREEAKQRQIDPPAP